MTVLILAAGLVFGMFTYECQEARELLKDSGTVCTYKHDLYKTK